MVEIQETDKFHRWIRRIKDAKTQAIIARRIRRVALGNAGDTKMLGDYVTELRIDYGSGYRIYFTTKGSTIVLLLVGGTKKTQSDDIKEAKRMAKEVHLG